MARSSRRDRSADEAECGYGVAFDTAMAIRQICDNPPLHGPNSKSLAQTVDLVRTEVERAFPESTISVSGDPTGRVAVE
jgi:hypothetical protein